jgi:uncharacterized protein
VLNDALIDRIDLNRYMRADVGLPTLRDITAELRRPGRDPRATFELPAFRDDITTPQHLEPGMKLEGVVTNLVAFGAFVDIGVHQDGLVHVSQLADRFVRDPADVVNVGQKVSVRVLSVDLERNRIALTMKTAATPAVTPAGQQPRPRQAEKPRRPQPPQEPPSAPAPRKGDVAPNGMRFR